jgi:hypothetical protein
LSALLAVQQLLLL